jgi:hypothetical protein
VSGEGVTVEHSIAPCLGRIFGERLTQCQFRIGAFDRAVICPLNKIKPPGEPQIVLVDALDEALDFEATGNGRPNTIVCLLAAHAKRLPAWLSIFATSRERQEV